MAANNNSLSPSSDTRLWVPTAPQKERKVIQHRPRNGSVEASNTIWLPPSTQNEIKELAPPRRRWHFRPALRLPRVQLDLGFKHKTFWDWLPLLLQLLGILVISASLLLGLARFASQQTQEQDRLAQQTFQEQVRLAQQEALVQTHLATQVIKQQQQLVLQEGALVDQGHEQILSAYFTSMTDLLPALKRPNPDSTARLMAQTRTLAILNAFKADPTRVGIILQFLHDAGLISASTHTTKGPVIQLNNVTLSGLNLKQANLNSTNFDGVTMSGVNLSQAVLSSSIFRGAILTKAVLSNADLTNADLSGANLENADLTGANLKGANLSGADTKNARLKGVIW